MQTWQQDTKYSISNVYKLLITQVDEVNWVHGVWHRMTLPKHRVISWLGVQSRLQTKEKLLRHCISHDNTCCICGSIDETHSHVFFECSYSKQVMIHILNWIGVTYRQRTLPQWLMWIRRCFKGAKTRRGISITSIHVVAYHVWIVRNIAYWQQHVNSIHNTVNSIQHITRHRVLYCIPRKKCNSQKVDSKSVRVSFWITGVSFPRLL